MPCHERIRSMRKARGLSLNQLSERLIPHLPVMSKKTLSKIENGKRAVLADELPYIAHALGCRPEDLLDPVQAD